MRYASAMSKRDSECPTSHAHCARNTSSSNPAKNCGWPKRSRVKNFSIGKTECFTMSCGVNGEFHHMDETASSELPLQISPPVEPDPVQPPLSGPSGVGWGFLLYLLMFFMVLAITSTALRFLMPETMAQIHAAPARV